MAAMDGHYEEAARGWQAALEIDHDCLVARLNCDLVEAELSQAMVEDAVGALKLAPAPGQPLPGPSQAASIGDEQLIRSFGRTEPPPHSEPPEGRADGLIQTDDPVVHASRKVGDLDGPSAFVGVPPSGGAAGPGFRLKAGLQRGPALPFEAVGAGAVGPIRVAILSFLFNWPSTGGGNHHTAELAQFLARAGYEVKHLFARYPGWGIGRVTDELISPSEAIEFDESCWTVAEIQARYRKAVDAFAPDYVIITDSWNMKPLLAEAVRDYPFFMLYQAQENICPLNNLRLLAAGPDRVEQCPRNQLATPEVCCGCLAERGHHSGTLHRAERELAGVGTRDYDRKLRRSLMEAEAVLVLNPVIEAMIEPYASRVRIVPWGMDAARFPWPLPDERPSVGAESGVVRPAPKSVKLFMAAVAGETIKGYHVAHEASRILRESRSDFELVVTFDPPGPIDEFTRSVGWCSLADLPRHYREADICLVPTIAQDSLSRTSVEAMASGIPVVASRIGGLPYTVTDSVTGLLFEPGDPVDLARQIAPLLDDPALRRRMGLAGRQRFEDDFVWEDVIERYFRPLLAQRRVGTAHQ